MGRSQKVARTSEKSLLSQYALLWRPRFTLLEYQHLYQTEASMNSIQLEVIPHQTGVPVSTPALPDHDWRRHHYPEDHPNADKLIGYFKYQQTTANIWQVVNLALVDVGGFRSSENSWQEQCHTLSSAITNITILLRRVPPSDLSPSIA